MQCYELKLNSWCSVLVDICWLLRISWHFMPCAWIFAGFFISAVNSTMKRLYLMHMEPLKKYWWSSWSALYIYCKSQWYFYFIFKSLFRLYPKMYLRTEEIIQFCTPQRVWHKFLHHHSVFVRGIIIYYKDRLDIMEILGWNFLLPGRAVLYRSGVWYVNNVWNSWWSSQYPLSDKRLAFSDFNEN